MSKKSRRRNKKILGLLGAIGLGLAARNKRNKAIDTGIQSAKDDSGSDMMEFKEQVVSTPVSTKTTIMDSMPARPKKNPLSKRIKKNTNEVYTIKGGNTGVGNTKSVFKGDDGYLRSGVNATPMTGGRFGTYKAAKEMERGALPPQLRTPRKPITFGSGNDGLSYFKKGGRVKGCGIAKKGLGRAMRKGRK
jgi:hypothetical protein